MKIAVLGSGGWGTALAMLLAENGHTVTLWSYLEEESRRLQQTRENPLLPGVTLPESLSYTWDLSCVRGCGVVVMATPSFGVRSTAEGIRGMLTPETILVSVSKGIEKGSSLRMTEIIRQATGDLAPWWPSPVPPTPRRWPGGAHRRSRPARTRRRRRRCRPVFERPLPGTAAATWW
ncbi:MAG: 2-dehydropantoate 2-reductase N-terminal domain-containing protein [Evtepia gabavorous]